ncbi:hypothetical protein [Glaciimonas soli]|uniref:hypothetical protein n=1 Tax=Glaciimonas soli TaxID=2590999 RepID=UPI001884BF4D|nr:hypothetical protein [Glaciimonas soli]
MFDVEKTSPKALGKVADWLILSMLKAHRQPVSLMIAALFPIIYRELAKADDVSADACCTWQVPGVYLEESRTTFDEAVMFGRHR